MIHHSNAQNNRQKKVYVKINPMYMTDKHQAIDTHVSTVPEKSAADSCSNLTIVLDMTRYLPFLIELGMEKKERRLSSMPKSLISIILIAVRIITYYYLVALSLCAFWRTCQVLQCIS